jgi:hypothetical protein
LPAIYQLADWKYLFTHQIREGFGIPILEALNSGDFNNSNKALCLRRK